VFLSRSLEIQPSLSASGELRPRSSIRRHTYLFETERCGLNSKNFRFANRPEAVGRNATLAQASQLLAIRWQLETGFLMLEATRLRVASTFFRDLEPLGRSNRDSPLMMVKWTTILAAALIFKQTQSLLAQQRGMSDRVLLTFSFPTAPRLRRRRHQCQHRRQLLLR